MCAAAMMFKPMAQHLLDIHLGYSHLGVTLVDIHCVIANIHVSIA